MKNVIVVMLALTCTLTSCTPNEAARKWGGEKEIDLPTHQVVVNVSWKGDELWVCTRDTVTGEIVFQEHSKFGLLEGRVTFK